MLKNILFIPILMMNLIILINASTTISTCTTINSSYVFDTDRKILLVSDILNYDGTCMDISESNIILDCQDNLIQGDGDSSGNGIDFTTTVTNVTIQNCQIEKFNNGFFRNAGLTIYNINIYNSTIKDNLNSAFTVHASSSKLMFKNNQLINNSNGLIMRGNWDDSEIINNNFINNTGTCINSWDNGPDSFNISKNLFEGCNRAIQLGDYHRYSHITNNIFTNNNLDLYLNGASTTPENNIIYDNTLNSSKISGNNFENNLYNLSTIGNIWLDYNDTNPFCFGSPNVCDYNPRAYSIPEVIETSTQQTITSLPSISTYSIIGIISIILISLF
jgi:hypothetical protein